MVNEILTAAGVEHVRGHFSRMPAGPYAVCFDDIEVITVDRVSHSLSVARIPRIYNHSVTVELYEPLPDDTIHEAIEVELNARCLEWTKQDRYYLKELQRYQTIYEFSYTSK